LESTVFLEIIYLYILSPKNLNTLCKFVKIDHAEASKILVRKRSGFLQEVTLKRQQKEVFEHN